MCPLLSAVSKEMLVESLRLSNREIAEKSRRVTS
jgi:hypothetical protein